MVTRYRIRALPALPTGKSHATNIGGWDGARVTWAGPYSEESVQDEIWPGNGHYFFMRRFGDKTPPMRINGKLISNGMTMSNVPIVRSHYKTDIDTDVPIGDIPSLAASATELAKMTNPSRPHIDIPVAIKELFEIPQLLLERSNDVGRDISRGRLSLEFGWKPLIGDFMKVLSLHEALQSRVRELDHLSRTGIRRKRRLYRGSSMAVASAPTTLFAYNDAWVQGHVTRSTTVEVWGFCKWVPDRTSLGAKLGLYDHSNASKALMAILGITPTIVDLSSIWELIPFSWLVDWTTNVGDYLAANRNLVGAKIEKIQIMNRTITQATMTHTFVSPGLTIDQGSGTRQRTDLKRTPVSSLSLEAHLPFLNERKVAILADVVNGIFRRSKIDHRKGAKTSWNMKESFKDAFTSGL